MSRLILKFGGTSVESPKQIKEIAKIIALEASKGHEMVVIVSAMSGATNQLMEACDAVGAGLDAREMDVILSSGEQASAGLLALALQGLGLKARSWMAWQLPLRTNMRHLNASISEINIAPIEAGFKKGQIAIIPGFQGLSENNRITTLGRGGSDLTAVALAGALKADRCDIYTDVTGIYSSDPNKVARARKIDVLSYAEMLEMARYGAKVMQMASVVEAQKWGVPIQVLSAFNGGVGSELKGTLIVASDSESYKDQIAGFAVQTDCLLIHLTVAIKNFDGFYQALIAFLRAKKMRYDGLYFKEENKEMLGGFIVNVLHKKQLAVFLKKASLKAYNIDANYIMLSLIGRRILEDQYLAQKMESLLSEQDFFTPFYFLNAYKFSILLPASQKDNTLERLHSFLEIG